MPSNKLHDVIETSPLGVKFSFAVKIQGLPYYWTDGNAPWEESIDILPPADNPLRDLDERVGLGTQNFSFMMQADPKNPLDTGDGLSITIADDQTGLIFDLFSPVSGDVYALTESITNGSTTTIVLESTGGLTVGELLYSGLETFEVLEILSATEVRVGRRRYDSIDKEHIVIGQGVVPKEIRTSPTEMRGRTLSIYMAPLSEVGRLDTKNLMCVWAGLVDAYTLRSKIASISCSPLSLALKKKWPTNIPKGTLSSPSEWLAITLEPDNLFINVQTIAGSAHQLIPLGRYVAGVFTLYSGYVQLSIELILQAINDTLENAGWGGTVSLLNDGEGNYRIQTDGNDASTPFFLQLSTSTNPMRHNNQITANGVLRNFLVAAGVTAGGRSSPDDWYFTNSTDARNNPFGNLGVEYWQIIVLQFNLDIVGDDEEETQPDSIFLPVSLETTDNPFLLNDANRDYFYISVTDGSDQEIMAVGGDQFWPKDSVPSDFDGIFVPVDGYLLAVGARGLFGTSKINWNARAATKQIDIKQIVLIDNRPVHEVVLNILHGWLGGDRNGITWDTIKLWNGPGVLEDYIDVQGITDALHNKGPQLEAFWVDEEGGGEEALEELLKNFGVYFITKRVGNKFMLSLEDIGLGDKLKFDYPITDSHRLADSDVKIDNNERVIINQIKFQQYRYPLESEPTGRVVVVNDLRSISNFGASEELEVEAPFVFRGQKYIDSLRSHYGANAFEILSVAVADKWFKAFAYGNYTLTVPLPFAAVGVQVGDLLKLSLEGVPDVDGTINVVARVGKVIAVSQAFGNKGDQSYAVVRINYRDINQLAPTMLINSYVGGTGGFGVEVDINTYTDITTRIPYSNAISEEVADSMWFDTEIHGASIPVYIYAAGDYANGVNNTVTGFFGGPHRIALGSSLSAAFPTIPIYGLRVEFPEASLADLFSLEYAYIANCLSDGSILPLPQINKYHRYY